jgi:hypothetical protein
MDWVFGDFVPVFQYPIPEVIPSQKCHMNIGSLLNGYTAMDIWNSRWFEPYVKEGHSCISTQSVIIGYTSSKMG